MKDFAEAYLQPAYLPANTDPYLYTTPEVRDELLEMQGSAFSSLNAAHIIAVLLTAPLTTITASLQLSVKPHKKIYEEPMSKSTELARTNTALTLQQKRKMQLMLRAGGQQRPYTAPVYEGYAGVVRGLAGQGWKAFFKGLFFRSVYQLGNFYAFYEVGMSQNNRGGLSEALSFSSQLAKLWALQSACGMSLNVFHLAENRYILQNCLPEFRVFRNGSRVIRKMISRKEIFTAASYHIYHSFVEVFIRLPLYLSLAHLITAQPLALLYLSELITYPLNTAFRRLTCQHSDIPGMIPIRYTGLGHALHLIPSEEGLIGLYRGFGLHHLTIAARLSCLSLLAPWLSKIQP